MKSYNFHLISLLVLVVFFSVVCPQKSHAALTKQLSYQGRLNNASGQPVANGTYSIVFSIYNVSTGGSALWTETQNVSVDQGGFSAYLGSVTALTLPFNEDYYLGIKVGSDPEMTPRLKLAIVGTSAFAFEAGKLEGKAASDFALSTHNHDSNYSASAHTHTATGVTQIIAGANVTISPTGGTGVVTINAAGGGGGSSLTPASTVQPVTSASVVGTSTNYAREDHQHNIVSNFITDSMVSSSAGIATSKLSGTVTAISGHGLGSLATLNAVGSAQITDGTITFTDIAQNGCASGQVVEWNGSAWNCGTDDVGGGGGVITNPTSTQTIIAGNSTTTPLVVNSAASPSVNIFDVQNNGTSAMKVSSAGNLLVGNPATTTAKVSALETGTANHAGYFEINNASSLQYAVFGSTNGSGDAVYGYTTGTGIAGEFQIINASNTSDAIKGTTTGTGRAGFFQINNATNSNPAVYGITNGTGNAVYGYTTSTGGKGGYFEIDNASNANSALNGFTIGTGNAGNFQISNASNSNPVVVATTNGTGVLFKGNTTGTGNLLQLQQGAVDKFVVDNAGNITVGGAANTVKNNPSANQTIQPTADVVPLIIKDDAAATADLFDVQNNGGTTLVKVNPSGNLLVGNPVVTAAKVSAEETGTANKAGAFEIMNVSNANSALLANTTGTGNAGEFGISNGSNASAVLVGDTSGTGNLLQLTKSGVNKFVVDNTGAITVGTVPPDPNAMKKNPAAAQTIQPTADVVPLILKDDAAATADLFDVQNNASASLVKVNSTGNLLVGNPAYTAAKFSAEETGTNYAGFFKVNNASNALSAIYAVTTGTGSAVEGYTSGTGYAGNFAITNGANSSALLFGNNAGTGNLLQLQQSGVDKFVVDNTGAITVGGAANTVKTNPSANQTIQPTADVVPLIIKDDAAATADLFDVQNNASASLVKVNPSGNLLVGNPGTTAAKLSAEEAGTANYAGYFKIGNAANANASVFGYTVGTGDAVYGYTIGTGKAGYFRIDNVSNAAPLIMGNTTGTGNLIQLQQAGINKFVVDNTGNVLLDGNANPSIKASGATPNLILDADGTGASIVKVKNTTSPGSVLFQTEGAITAFNGTNAVPVSSGATQELIQKGNACEAIATNGTITVTFTPAFSATPTVTFGQTGGTTAPAAISAKNSSSFTVSGFETGGTSECIDWIAIGNK